MRNKPFLRVKNSNGKKTRYEWYSIVIHTRKYYEMRYIPLYIRLYKTFIEITNINK